MSSSSAVSRLQNLASQIVPGVIANQTPVHIHQLSPNVFLPRAIEIEPEALAIVHKTSNGKDIRRTYQEFADRSRGLAYFLKSKGHKRVGLVLTNTPSFLEAFFGIGCSGGVQVAVNYRLKKDDVHYILGFAEVDSVIVDREFAYLLEGFDSSIPIYVDEDIGECDGSQCQYEDMIAKGLEYDKSTGGKGFEGLAVEPENEDSLIAIPFTSGTTALPKGVEYTHRGAYLASLANVVESQLVENNCRYLWTLPLFHATGWTFPWSVTAVRGTHICLRRIDYDYIWDILVKENVTHFNAAPTVNTLLANHEKAKRLDHEVRVTVAASPPSAFLLEKMFSLNLRPVHVYGCTETYGPITKSYALDSWEKLDRGDKFKKMSRQGHGFLTSKKVRVIKTEVPDGTIIDVKQDGKEIGEIIFQGNICAKGYHKDAEATKKLFAGGVMHSGDLAVWHPDGAIQLVDRSKDIIISGGENISSVALEAMLAHHPQILEAGVVAMPDEKWGERAKAFITVKSGSKISGEEVIKWAKEQSSISKFMVPREVEVVDELPKTSTGKLQKTVLRDWAKKKSKSS